jgi:hypothetical protein
MPPTLFQKEDPWGNKEEKGIFFILVYSVKKIDFYSITGHAPCKDYLFYFLITFPALNLFYPKGVDKNTKRR